MNLEQLPYRPGDIVRDRKSSTDYVVESIAGFSLSAGVVVYAVALMNDRLDSWKVNSEAEMTAGHILLRKGDGLVSSSDIKKNFTEKIENLTRHNKDIMNELDKAENSGLKDLLMYGVIAETDESQFMSQALINLTESIVHLTGKVPDKQTIYKLLKADATISMTDEGLHLFAENIHSYAKSKKSVSRFMQSGDLLDGILTKADGSIGGDAFTLMAGFGRRFSGSNDPIWKTKAIQKILLGPNADLTTKGIEHEIFGTLVGNMHPQDRIREIAKRMFLAKSGRSELAPETEQFLSKDLIKAVEKSLRGKLNDKDPNAAGATLLLNAIANWFVDPSMEKTSLHLSKLAPYAQGSLSTMNPSKLNKARMNRLYNFAQRAMLDYKMVDYKDQYTRATSIGIKRKPLNALKLMSLENILPQIEKPGNNLFAISKDAFHNSVLGSAKLKLGRVEGNLRSTLIREELARIDPHADPYYVVSSRELMDIRKHIAANDSSTPVDLTYILGEQAARRDSLNPLDQEALRQKMLSLRHDSGSEVILPIRNKRNTTKLAYNITDHSSSIYTVDASRAQSLLEANPNATVVPIDMSGRKASRLYSRLSELEANAVGPTESKRLWAEVNQFSHKEHRQVNASRGVVADILKTKVMTDKLKVLKLGKFSEKEIRDAEAAGYKAGKLAITNIRTSEGLNKVSFLASDMSIQAKEQTRKGIEFFEGRGILLDIESYVDPRTNLSKAWEVAIGTSKKEITTFGKKNQTVHQQANMIINLTEKLQEHLSSGKTVIGTAGPHDFNTLIQNAENLINKIDGIKNLSTEGRETLKARVTQSLEILSSVQKNNLFDVQILHQMAGYSAGGVRQDVLTASLLTDKNGRPRRQIHRAKQDVSDLFEILGHIKERSLQGIQSASWDGEEIINKGLFYMNRDTMSSHGPGQIKKLVGNFSYTDASGKEQIALRYHLHESKQQADGTYKLVPTHVLGEDTFDSSLTAAAMLERHSSVFTAEQFNTISEGTSIAKKHASDVAEAMGRRTRSYNPFALTRWDPLDEWSTEQGSFAAMKMELDARTAKLFPQVLDKYQELAQKLLGPNQTELTALQHHKLLGQTDKVIERLIKKSGPDAFTAQYGKYLHASLQDTLNDTSLLKEDYLNPNSEFHKLMNSEAGSRLLRSASKANGTLESNGFRVNADTSDFEFQHIFYGAAAAEKAAINMSKANKVSDFYTAYKARLSLKFGNAATSLKLDTANDISFAKINDKFNSLAAQAMLDPLENNAPVKRALEHLQIGEQEFSQLMDQFKEANSLGDMKNNLDQWKTAIEKLAYSGEDKEFKELKTIRQVIQSQNSQEALINAIQDKVDNLHNMSRIESDVPQRRKLQSDLETAKKVLQQLKDIPSDTQGEKLSIRASEILNEAVQQHGNMDFLRDWKLNAPKLYDLSSDELNYQDQLLAETRSMLHKHLENNTEQITEAHIMADVAYHARLAEQTTLGSFHYYTTARRRLLDISKQLEQGNTFTQILSQSHSITEKRALATGTATALADAMAGNTGSVVQEVSELVTKAGPALGSASKAYSRVSVPLLALGGLVGYLAAKQPTTGQAFSQGNVSERGGFTGDEAAISKYSEVPGNPDQQAIWYGQTDPFRLDITFRGFVGDRIHHQQLQREVFNIISSNMEIRRNSGSVEDRRNRHHKLAAIEAVRGNI